MGTRLKDNPRAEGTEVTVHGEYPKIKGGAGQLTDHFAPLEVHVYLCQEKE